MAFFPAPRQSPRGALLATRVLVPMVAAHFAFAYINGTSFYVDPQTYADGHARLPFQYRALAAWIIHAALHLPGLGQIAARQPDELLQPITVVMLALVFASTLWIVRSARQTAATIFPHPLAAGLAALTFFAPLYIGYEAPSYHFRFAYPYDLPSLALFFAAFVALLHGTRMRLLALFTLATISRETSVLLIPILLIWTWPAAGRPPLLLPAAMTAIWLAVKLMLAGLYAGNASEAAFMHQAQIGGMVIELGDNIADIISPFRWPSLLSLCCWLWLPVLLFWRDIDHAPLRRAIRILTPAWLLAMLLVGRLREARVFEELTILYWMATLIIVQQSLTAGRTSKATFAIAAAPPSESHVPEDC